MTLPDKYDTPSMPVSEPDSSTPRTWTLIHGADHLSHEDGDCVACVIDGPEAVVGKRVEVIEKSAYATLKADNERLVSLESQLNAERAARTHEERRADHLAERLSSKENKDKDELEGLLYSERHRREKAEARDGDFTNDLIRRVKKAEKALGWKEDPPNVEMVESVGWEQRAEKAEKELADARAAREKAELERDAFARPTSEWANIVADRDRLREALTTIRDKATSGITEANQIARAALAASEANGGREGR